MHTANELNTKADILAADGSTVLAACVPCGVTDLSGRNLERAQLVSAETTHMMLFHFADAETLTSVSYLRCEDILYIVDYRTDPRKPRPRTWAEVYCHVDRGNA